MGAMCEEGAESCEAERTADQRAGREALYIHDCSLEFRAETALAGAS